MRIGNKSATLLLALALLLEGCTGLSPLYSIGGGDGSYRVRKGDTLYSIAFRYGLDYKSLARINRIGPPYTIYTDQLIRLRGSAKRPEKDSGPTATKPVPKRIPSAKARLPEKVAGWRWPINGKVIAGFSLTNPINKGIDIAGNSGDAVVAAADGVVVYAGGNLRGYGKLVIIKHNDHFLSAYGNNETMLVREGEKVRAGRTIARVGTSAANTEMLHFEIRREGKPENPLNYLPARG
ncbi:MAG: peptidoglycan DD-metalloendopeptidase family protein [Gammaproteobacteria bacterium]|jgi:lipoprotein NlpD|nr:peptidoglycan DD-metalloendopeptidase family protein [Gammaproteobacteria bacterium]MBT4492729.1 peptidoglycan DD-metalloendopeptidase family protein [Gammaproteobacteria bacterium]MBT7370162.1 peptidoglycan DD-metalloendopeptidase family protein [Gammaproteobacteria bacterium]